MTLDCRFLSTRHSTSNMTRKNIGYLAAVALLWLLFAQAMRGAVISSLAFDEGPHLAVGYATLRTGDFACSRCTSIHRWPTSLLPHRYCSILACPTHARSPVGRLPA